MPSELFNSIKKNPLLLGSLVIDESLYQNFQEIVENCRKLQQLKIGQLTFLATSSSESIWDGEAHRENTEGSDSSSSEDEEGTFELDVKLIASNLNDLRILHLGSGIQFKRQPVAPPTIEHELSRLEELRICLIRHRLKCDTTRDEWNLRILAQNSTELKRLDLRGCYLKIFSLGWLKTEKLESLHLYYQVPAASILIRWSRTLRYITLVKISSKYRRYRSMGPTNPAEELNACLLSLASAEKDSKLVQIDLHESDCSLEAVKHLIRNCQSLSYIDTLCCETLPEDLRVQITSRPQILDLFDIKSNDCDARTPD